MKEQAASSTGKQARKISLYFMNGWSPEDEGWTVPHRDVSLPPTQAVGKTLAWPRDILLIVADGRI
ncbi:MAG TPA: hypothetical protein DDW98_13840, partial [Gammaproteobacteria bacterium]|nr:hypothetical protein [Gammaproteobacteria bacterium]